MSKTKTNFWLDLIIFSAFLLTAGTGLLLWLAIPSGPGSGNTLFLGFSRHTWVDWHNWAGLSLLVGAGIHLALHWSWLECVAGRFFKPLGGSARLNFSLDSLLFSAFLLANVSGLVLWLALPGGGYRGGRNPFLLGLTRHDWSDLHWWAGLAMMVILTVHLALHWHWIVCVARRYAHAALGQANECVSPQI
jgi:hypothetical protein